MPSSCPLCGSTCSFENSSREHYLTRVRCENGHSFSMPVSLLSVDQHDLNLQKIRFYNIINEYLLAHGGHSIVDGEPCDFVFYNSESGLLEIEESRFVDLENEMLNYPYNFTEKIDRALINLSRKYPHLGDSFIHSSMLDRTLFLETGDSITIALHFFVDLNYLEIHNGRYFISVMGWKHIAELTRSKSEIDQGFIAMAFNQDTQDIRDSFKTSIQECGFKYQIMDEKEHNNQIVPEMFHEIKRSKFMVVDITYPNYGAYYEAGYAQALGKEVIICCRDAEYHSTDKTARPHFDIAQKPTVVWESYEDLKVKLSKRIAATVTK